MFNKKTDALDEIIELLKEVLLKFDEHLDYTKSKEMENYTNHIELLESQIKFYNRKEEKEEEKDHDS